MQRTRRNAAFLVAIGLLTTSASRAPAAESERQFERWAKAIAAFDQSDRRDGVASGEVVFVGSSSIRLWKLATCFPDLNVVNRGFGGSQICDSVHYFDVLVARRRPRTVVFYAGDNDVAAGKSAQQVVRDFRAFRKKLTDALPETRLIYIAIKPSRARWHLADTMQAANRLIAAECRPDRRATFVDVWEPMLGRDDQPKKDLFIDDGLHLNESGYRLWTELVRPHLILKPEE
ncbi:MAG: SGNH/GDSL hydrolase family protein [Planctomycetota bacterium]